MKWFFASRRFHGRFAHIEKVHNNPQSKTLPYKVFAQGIDNKDFGTLDGAKRYLKKYGFVQMTDGVETQSDKFKNSL